MKQGRKVQTNIKNKQVNKYDTVLTLRLFFI